MKKVSRIVLTVLACLAVAMPASAQFRFGLKAGVNVNSLHFNESILGDFTSDENRTGFTGGLTCEFTVPLLGLGFDASVMYVHRSNLFNIPVGDPATSQAAGTTTGIEKKDDFIEIPLNLKWKIGLPVVGKLITPYVFTGPSFAFRASKADIVNAYKSKAFDAAWNLGVGVELFERLQVGASYGWGMTKAMEYVGVGNESVDLGKQNCWTVTAAYFF